ncbi:mCG140272 [Mus musculus]|nr:mCG140272 [Mus musculus]
MSGVSEVLIPTTSISIEILIYATTRRLWFKPIMKGAEVPGS